MVGVIWYRFVRYSGTDWSATLVPIGAMRWYRFIRYSGTDSPILSLKRSLSRQDALERGHSLTAVGNISTD